MVCSISGITNSVASVDKAATKASVKQAVKTTSAERALATDTPVDLLSDIIKNSKPTLQGKKVHVVDLARTDDGEFTIKYKVGRSGAVLELPLGASSPFKNSYEGFNIDKNNLETLHSDHEYSHNNDDFEALALDITNNPEKIVETANYLIDADEYHNDESYNDVLLGQLSSIQEKLVDMVPKINVHINNQGDGNFGEINVDTGDVFISKGVGGSKSLLEIYVHELYHSITHFALSSVSTEVRKVTARMEKVREHFLENTEEADLVMMSGNILTEEQASAILDHLTDPKVGLHEFVALAMSNKAVMNQLSTLNTTEIENGDKSLLQSLLDLVAKVFQAVSKKITGEPDSDDLSRMVFLVNKLHTSHKKPLRARKFYAIKNLISMFEPLEKKFSLYLDEKIEKSNEKADRNVAKKGEGNLRYYTRLAARSMFDDQAKNILGNVAGLASFRGGVFSALSPEGTIRTIIRDATQSDLTQDQAEALGMLSGHIDQQRQFLAVQTSKVVLSYFDNKELTAGQEEMLTSMVLDTDLSAIYATHDMDKLLSSNLEINKVIADKENKLVELADESAVNFYKTQTSLLSEYMVNGKDHIALLMNAENIAKMVGTNKAVESVSNELVSTVDELTTLKALKISSKRQKLEFRELIKEEPEGVSSLVAFHLGQKERAAIDVFPTASDKLKIIKGHSVQFTDPDISIVSAPLAKKKEMETKGYKLHKELGKHSMDTNNTPMALYKNNRFMETSFHRVGMRLTEKSRRGVTVTESFTKGADDHKNLKAAASVRVLKNRRLVTIGEMFDGTYDVSASEEDSLLSPTLNNLGQVTDFRYGMDKKIKEEVLETERKISVVMGKTAASTYDKKESDSFNKKMMDLILEDANKNKVHSVSVIGKNDKEYVKIEKNSTNDDIAALWRVLPENIKSVHKNGFYVRRDLMYTYLGYREMGVEDVLGFGLLNRNNELTKVVKHALMYAEKLWQELVKISKIDIIIRTPGVFIGNVISNFVLMYATGHSIKEITTLKYQGVKELNLYTEGLKESITLRAKEEAGLITPKELRRLNVIENNMHNSPVKDLVAEGFYTTIVEEIEHGGDTGSYFNRQAKKKLKNMPKIFRNGLDILYVTENTKLFKLVEKGIQASDFAARYAQYHLMVEGGTPKAEAVKSVRDNFIDYNKPNSKFVEWANKNGFVMFTKYFTRIQRVLRNYGTRHPAKLLLSVLGQEYVLGDLDDMTDQSVLTKDMGNMLYNPWDHLMRVITPSALEAVASVGNGISISSEDKV